LAKRQLLGRYIVVDPEICHGKPTFRGTRIMAADVLDQIAAGLAWETIIEEWRGNISKIVAELPPRLFLRLVAPMARQLSTAKGFRWPAIG